MILNAQNVTLSYGDRKILDDIGLVVEEKEKTALVGVNGTGKSTLLKVLAGIESASGSVVYRKGLEVSMLEQNPVFSEDTVWKEIQLINRKNAVPAEEYEIKSILTKLGITDFEMPINQMSGGQQKRLALAAALLRPSQLLLLDEPTNHLDNEMIDWLENWLVKSNKAIVMVTHDRYFLDRVCTRILELDKGKLHEHQGNYEVFLQNKQERLELEREGRAKLENLYRKELEWVRAGCQARSTKQKSRMDRFEKLRSQRNRQIESKLNLVNASVRLGKKIIEWHDLGYGYDQQLLFSAFSYVMKPHERLGIVGANGAGKTTLLKLLAGEEKPVLGHIEWGETVKLGWFRQGDDMDNLNMRVIDYVEDCARAAKIDSQIYTAASLLEQFAFERSMHQLPLYRLSGGERRRLYLLKVLMQPFNVLLLDEPTNDLDLMTLEILEDFLDEFTGAAIVISHDRYFLDRVCDSLMVLEEDRHFSQYMGGYSEYVLAKKEKAKLVQAEDSRKIKRIRERKPALSYMEKKELESLPDLLAALEEQVEAYNKEISSVQDYEEMAVLCQKRDEASMKLEEKTMRWLELEEKKEAAA